MAGTPEDEPQRLARNILACALTIAGFGVLWFALPLRQREYAAEHQAGGRR